MKIEGKTFIITGGASGLGEGTVRKFVQAGANVVIVDVNEQRGNEIVAELGKKTLFVKADITNEGVY
jgi:NAD(P)-dependent dehydrogenase (short-subunit alcohol dehydrogenase family)